MTYLEFCEKTADLIHEHANKVGFTEISTETLLKIVQTYVITYEPGHSSQYATESLLSNESLVYPDFKVAYNVTTPKVKTKNKKAETKKKKVAAKKKRK